MTTQGSPVLDATLVRRGALAVCHPL